MVIERPSALIQNSLSSGMVRYGSPNKNSGDVLKSEGMKTKSSPSKSCYKQLKPTSQTASMKSGVNSPMKQVDTAKSSMQARTAALNYYYGIEDKFRPPSVSQWS